MSITRVVGLQAIEVARNRGQYVWETQEDGSVQQRSIYHSTNPVAPERAFLDLDPRYLDEFMCVSDVVGAFGIDAGQLTDTQVVLAEYTYEDYSGSAWVVFVGTDGVLYEVNGGHCSCFGLEDQWEPEATSAEAILARPYLTDEKRALIEAWLHGKV